MKEKWKENEGKSELNLWLIFLKNIKGKSIFKQIYIKLYMRDYHCSNSHISWSVCCYLANRCLSTKIDVKLLAVVSTGKGYNKHE